MGGLIPLIFVCKNNFKKIKNFFKKPQPKAFSPCLIGERSVKNMMIAETMAVIIVLMCFAAICCSKEEAENIEE